VVNAPAVKSFACRLAQSQTVRDHNGFIFHFKYSEKRESPNETSLHSENISLGLTEAVHQWKFTKNATPLTPLKF